MQFFLARSMDMYYRTREVVIELSNSKNDCYISVEVIYICIDNLAQECLKSQMIVIFLVDVNCICTYNICERVFG